ncbi:MAG TPA: MaoC/PaaZ C-terminal domain-containing protein [Alphaproteobacteria bacterium]|nr:MaoC/PaaZ C-terminal domain-containing protein [Alphaproteobacteria bacterium]
MAIDPEALINWRFEDLEQAFTARETILYALGVGLGNPPDDRDQLPFVYEKGLKALPTMGVVLGYPGFWIKDPATGIDWRRVLHGEQGLELLAPLPAAGTVIGRTRVTGLIDKGKARGALMFSEREVIDKASGALLCRLSQTAVLRGDGGFGGPEGPVPPPHPIPERRPDLVCELPTVPQAALIYRLSGDDNPLHADPAIASAAGFPRPILHGLCTFGVVGHALLKCACGYRPECLKSMRLRFSAPVFPGEAIRTEMWREEGVLSFRAKVLPRDVVVINNGRAEIAA